MMTRQLESQGYSVHAITDPKQTVTCLKQNKFDLIISDYKMPEIDGIELIQEIRKLDEDIPIVVLTGYPTVFATNYRLQGPTIVTEKPYEMKFLTELIERLLQV